MLEISSMECIKSMGVLSDVNIYFVFFVTFIKKKKPLLSVYRLKIFNVSFKCTERNRRKKFSHLNKNTVVMTVFQLARQMIHLEADFVFQGVGFRALGPEPNPGDLLVDIRLEFVLQSDVPVVT
jgi:hypothetical protein